MKLLVRPLPQAHECLADYAGRLAARNGLRNGGGLYDALCANESATRLLDVPFAQLTAIDLQFSGMGLHWRGISFARSDILRGAAGVCCACLAETDIRPFLWRFWWSVACSRHATLLSARCEQCGRAHAVLAGTSVHCQCGLDLRTSRPAAMLPQSLVAFQATIDAAFALHARLAAPRATEHPAARLLCAPGGLGLLSHALGLVTSAGDRQGGSAALLRYARVEALESVFRQGEESVLEAWRSRLGYVFEARRDGRYCQAEADYMKRLRHWCAGQPPGTPLHALAQRLQAESRDFERTASLVPGGARGRSPATLSVTEISSRYGIPKTFLERMLSGGLLPVTLGRRAGKGRARMISSSIVAQLVEFRLKLLSRSEVAAQMGISELQVTALVGRGVLRSAWTGMRADMVEIPAEMVTRVFDRLAASAAQPPPTLAHQLQPLAAYARRTFGNQRAFAEILLQALQGHVAVYDMPAPGHGLWRWGVVAAKRPARRVLKP